MEVWLAFKFYPDPHTAEVVLDLRLFGKVPLEV